MESEETGNLPASGVPKTADDVELFPVYHLECGGIAFYTKHKWKSGDMILATQITLLDGRHPVAFSSPVCGSCQEPPATLTFEKPHGK